MRRVNRIKAFAPRTAKMRGIRFINLSSLSLVVRTETLGLAFPFPLEVLTVPPRLDWNSEAAWLISTTESN
jgi:hypothetical protein